MASCDTSSLIDSNLELLTEKCLCFMCQSTFKDPKILPCLHCYCKDCLDKEIQRSGAVVCPKCNLKFELSEMSIKKLPNMFLNSELKDLYSALSITSHKDLCEVCKLFSTQAYCQHCSKYLCPFCYEAHKHSKTYMDCIVLKQSEVSGHLDELDSPVRMICPNHDEEMKAYCHDCNQLICQDCTTTKHQKHNCNFITQISESVRKELELTEESLQYTYSSLNENRSEIERIITQKHEEGTNTMNHINRSFDIVLSQFEKYRSNLLKSLQNKVDAEVRELKLKDDNLEAAQRRIQPLLSFLQKNMKNPTVEEVVHMHKSVTQKASEAQKSCKDKLKLTDVTKGESFTVYKTSCARIIGAIGDSLKCADPIMCTVEGIQDSKSQEIGKETKLILYTNQSNEAPCLGLQNVKAELKCIDDDYKICDVQVEAIKGNTYSIKYTPKKQGLYILNVKVNDRPVLGNPFKILVRKSVLEMNNPTFIIKGVKKLKDIAYHCNGYLLATQYETGSVLSIDKQGNVKPLIRDLGRPFGITTSSQGEIFITQSKKCRLLKYNKYLELVKRVGSKESTLGNFCKPGRLANNKQNEIIVCDEKNSRIQIFDNDLDYIRWYSISKPTGASVDSKGDIYIAENRKNNLCKVLDNSKEGTIKIRENLSNPQGMYLDSEYIYVSEKGKGQVTVLDHKGELVTTLGQGVLKEPGGIVCDDHGYLYVCDEELEAIYVF